jgi:hypothetical protein
MCPIKWNPWWFIKDAVSATNTIFVFVDFLHNIYRLKIYAENYFPYPFTLFDMVNHIAL